MIVDGLKKYSILIFLLILSINSSGYYKCSFEHYSDKDGLSQSTINDIYQDKQGYIWLGTFDGLVRFNGYEFESFKITASNSTSKSNRIDKIKEDKYGRLWLKSLNDVYCFDTKSGKFWSIPLENIQETNNVYSTEVYTTSSGKVWLLMDNKNLVCIEDSLFTIKKLSSNNEFLSNKTIFSIHEDFNHNNWILTNNGLLLIPNNSDFTIQSILFNKAKNSELNKPFYTFYESEKEIWFGSSLGRIWIYSKDSHVFSEFNLNIKSNILEIKRMDDSQIVILTESDGIFVYNKSTNNIKTISKTNIHELKSNQIGSIFPVDNSNIWFTTNEIGIYKINISTNQLKHYKVEVDDRTIYQHPPAPIIIRDHENNLWIHPKGGGFSFYNKETDELEAFYNKANDPQKKFSNIIHDALFDRQGNLWMSTRTHGLEKVSFSNNDFKSIKVSNNENSSLSNNVRSIFQLSNQNILIGTKEGRLLMFSNAFQYLVSISATGIKNDNSLWPSAIYCITEDSEGRIWIGTRGNGIYVLTTDNTSGNFIVQNFVNDQTNPYSLSNNNVYSIIEDKNKNIWCGTLGGGINLLQYNQHGKYRFINSSNKLKNYPGINCNRVRCISVGTNGNIYAGTSNGLVTWQTDFNSPETLKFNHYTSNSFVSQNLSSNEIMSIQKTKDGIIYIGTYGGGLNKIIHNQDESISGFKSYNNENSLASDGLLSLEEDSYGNIWISTENNLIRFNPHNELFEAFYELNQLTFSESASILKKDNSILLGYSDGLISFNPDFIATDTLKSNIIFTDFQLFNTEIKNNSGAPFKGNINDENKIELEHYQNFFNIQFSTLDYQNTRQIQYAYKLEGFDNEWYYAKKQRIANYTNIPKGSYIFKVKSTNGRGTWLDNERSINIIVKPSFGETPIAYILYALIFFLIFFILQKYILTIYKLKSDIKIQKEISDMKLKFFTDVSHEIRTPLTMITSPIEHLIEDQKTPDEIRNQLKYISHGTQRLLNLVNQILDFRKIQDKHLKIKKINFCELTERICTGFIELANEKNYIFNFKNISRQTEIWADENALDKILMNLLSNAFKYCESGDSINVSLNETEKYAILKVSDTGPGISKLKQKDLFKRFSSFNDDVSKPSTGIGLSIIKEIADKHSAEVFVESEPEKGSTFMIRFLKGKNHFSDDIEIIADTTSTLSPLKEKVTQNSTIENSDIQIPDKKPTVLIVEDDNELRSFISSILSDQYQILESDNGENGITKAIDHLPDFIISDLMMPIKDGIELLKTIRNNIETSHIPVILLTAKSNIESKLEGLTYGADDYITKPFSVAYIKARIENLIQQRKRLHAIYQNNIIIDDQESPVKQNMMAPADELLMERIIEHIERNLDNNELSVENLTKYAGLSRTTFFNKIKSLTGQSPVEFIRDYRLKKAAHLIKTEQLLIKEICFMTGFSDLKYFGKCFKNKYGMTPGNYRKVN